MELPILLQLFKISNMKYWFILCLFFNGNCLLAQVIPVGFMQKGILPITGVTIGTQIWSNRNLEVTTYRNGDPITFASNATQWIAAKNAGTGAWTYYNWDAANGATYGKLYNWYAVNDSRGLAPLGWHIPTKAEYNTLASNSASSLKSTSAEWGANYGTNSTGFTGLPGGALNASVSFEAKGTSGWFWTSDADPINSLNAYWRILHVTAGFLDVGSYSKTNGMSVRLVKD